MLKKLNQKHIMFCHLVAAGKSKVDAYCEAFNNENRTTCQAEGSRLSNDPLIKEYIDELSQIRFKDIKGEISARRSVLNNIMYDTKETTSNRLRAADILNRMDKLYDVTQNDSKNDEVDDTLSNMTLSDIKQLIAKTEQNVSN